MFTDVGFLAADLVVALVSVILVSVFSLCFSELSVLISLINQVKIPHSTSESTRRLMMWMDFVRKANTVSVTTSRANVACVASTSVGVVPGVKMDSHSSVRKDIMVVVRCLLRVDCCVRERFSSCRLGSTFVRAGDETELVDRIELILNSDRNHIRQHQTPTHTNHNLLHNVKVRPEGAHRASTTEGRRLHSSTACRV